MSEACRLFLITPPVVDAGRFKPMLEAAVAADDVACVLIRTATRDDGDAKAILRVLVPIVQARGVAALVDNDAQLAARVDADGVHLRAPGPELGEALSALHPKRIVGVGGLVGRDEAMTAGEAGVDYLMFGSPDGDDRPDAVIANLGWWAAIFNVPCVGYARDPASAGATARTGAEFVALCQGLWGDGNEDETKVAATLAAVSRDLHRVSELVVGERVE